jgi:hypothetical protein
MEVMKHLKEALKAKAHKHWHKATVGGSLVYFTNALLEGNHAAGLMAALVLVGAVFHLGDVE